MELFYKMNHWWNTTCKICLQIRSLLKDIIMFFCYLLGVGIILSSGLFVYWIFFDTQDIIYYGNNARAEFYNDRIIFHLDAVRMRTCPAIIYRKISGCGQIDLPTTYAVTPVGNYVPPISFSLSILFEHFSKEQLSGNVCMLVSIAEGYCNPAQKLLKVPIITQSPPILFIPAPRVKTWQEPDDTKR